MTVEALAALLVETGHAHHQAFIETDGADPEWPIWYADHLHPKLVGDLGLTRSEIVYLLIGASRAADPDEPWPQSYAAFILHR